jgi:hypothetical protein
MPRGGHNRKRPVAPSGPTALTRWPQAPSDFTPAEVDAWKVVGEAAMLLGSVTGSDMILAGRLAQLGALVKGSLRDRELKTSTVSNLMRLEADLLTRMGLTPQARNSVGPVSKAKKRGPLDEF